MRILLVIFLTFALPASAQEPGLLDRLFGTDSAGSDGEQGSLIERILEDSLSGVGRDVRVRGFRGALSRRASLDSLVISDADGPWLELRDVELDWDRGALFNKRLVVNTLTAKSIELPRLPKSEQASEGGLGILQFKLPDLPVAVSIGEISAERVTLGASVLGQGAEVSVSGNMELASGEGSASLLLNRLDARGLISLNGAYSNETDILALDLSFDEAEDGIFANLAGVPGRPAVQFEATGEAPISNFSASIRLATDGEERLVGQVTASQPEGTSFRIVADIGGDVAPLFAPEYRPFFGPDVGFGAVMTRYPDGALAVENLSLTSRAMNLDGLVRLGSSGLPEEILIEGEIAHRDGSAVLLPLPGVETRVDRVGLDIAFDAVEGSAWQGQFDVLRLDRVDFAAAALELEGVGLIESTPKRVSGDFEFRAESPDLGDPGLNAALGDRISGALALDWQVEAPLRLSHFTLEGATYSASGQGSLHIDEEKRRIEGNAQATFEDLSVLSGLAGRSLQGGVDFTADGSATLDLSQLALNLSLRGQNVGVGEATLDTLLAGDLRADIGMNQVDDVISIDAFEVSSDLVVAKASGSIGDGNTPLAIEASLRDVAPILSEFSGPVSINGTLVDREDKRISIDISGRGPGGLQARVTGDVSRDASDLNLVLEGVAPLAVANRFIQPRSLSGIASYDLAVRGRPEISSVSGVVSFNSARFSDPELRLSLLEMGGDISITAGNAQVDLRADVDGGGRLALTGPVGLVAPNNADLQLQLFDVHARDPRLYDTTVNGGIRVAGPLAGGARISGELQLGETNVRIPQSGFGGSGAIPEVVHLNEPPPVRGTRRRAGLIASSSGLNSRRIAFPLDVVIRAPNQIFVRGRGLDSEFGGELRLGGSTAEVVPSGGFSLIRGRLDILGRRLRLEEALITMQGSFDPVLRILAVADVEDVRVNVLVEGPADNPEISFSSSPELPQEEVLSWLIFGRGLETLSPVQAARLALAVRTLSGQGGEGVVGKIRQRSGLADFDVTTDSDGSAAVRAGAYLSENIYTDVTVGSDGKTKLNLNLDVTPSVTVKGGFDNDGESSVGVFFEKDY